MQEPIPDTMKEESLSHKKPKNFFQTAELSVLFDFIPVM